MSKVKQAIQLTEVDSEYIQQMQEELQNTIKMFDLSREREDKNKQKVDNLQAEVKHLTSLLQQDSLMHNRQNKAVSELQSLRDQYVKEREQLNNYLVTLKEELTNKYEQVKELANEKYDLETDYKLLKKQNEEVNDKLKKDKDRNNRILKELATANSNYHNSLEDLQKIKEEQLKISQSNEKQVAILQEKQAQKEELSQEIDKLRKDIDILH